MKYRRGLHATIAAGVAIAVTMLTSAAGATAAPGSGGARSGDFTTDLAHDILARDARNGQLKVYPHSNEYHGPNPAFLAPVTINYGWAGMRWIGQGEMNADGRNDVLYIDRYGVLRMARHSGTWSGTSTLLPGEVVGTGWNINDLIYTDDFDDDGFDDVLARRAGTGDVYWYRNLGLAGTAMFQAPVLAVSRPAGDVVQTMGDFTNDSRTDLLFIRANGTMGLYNFVTQQTWELGYGWQTINAITIADVTQDGAIDVVGRRASDSALVVYANTANWSPQPDGTAYSTLSPPHVIGYNWYINDIIT